MIRISIILLILLSSLLGKSQIEYPDSIHFLKSSIIGNDTLPNITIKEIPVFSKKVFKNKREKRRYTRLMRNVKKAYPFAIIAKTELTLMNDSLQYLEAGRERKKFINDYEKIMFRKYEAKLRKLTFSQGKILIKLVYREFGNTSYYLVKEYRGDFSAVFWQGIARIFGSNLKSVYDPKGDDADIEFIVQLIEAGMI